MQKIIDKEGVIAKEWIHVGNDRIYAEGFNGVYNDQTSFGNKPVGGLWTSEKYYDKCPWFTYLEINPRYLSEPCDNLYKTKAAIIKLKSTANICVISTYEQLVSVHASYPLDYRNSNIEFGLDYEKIAEDYDGIYINHSIDKSLESWSVPTLNIFDSKAIASYQPIELNIKTDTIERCGWVHTELFVSIGKIYDQKKVIPCSAHYNRLLDHVTSFYNSFFDSPVNLSTVTEEAQKNYDAFFVNYGSSLKELAKPVTEQDIDLTLFLKGIILKVSKEQNEKKSYSAQKIITPRKRAIYSVSDRRGETNVKF